MTSREKPNLAYLMRQLPRCDILHDERDWNPEGEWVQWDDVKAVVDQMYEQSPFKSALYEAVDGGVFSLGGIQVIGCHGDSDEARSVRARWLAGMISNGDDL